MTIYECNADYKLLSISEIDDDATIEIMMKFDSNTTKAPSKAMLESYEKKECDLFLDPVKQKWIKRDRDRSKMMENLKRILDHEISGQIRNGTFEHRGMIFYTDDRSQLKWSETATSISLGLIKFPIEIKASGDNYLKINDQKEFSEFYQKFSEKQNTIREIGRLIKYGGDEKIRHLESFTAAEIDQISDAMIGANAITAIFEAILNPPAEEETAK